MTTRRTILFAASTAVACSAIAWLALRSPAVVERVAAPGAAPVVTSDAGGEHELRSTNVEAAPRAAAAVAPSASEADRRVVADPTRWSQKVRGRVVDARTGEGVPRVRVRIQKGRLDNERVLADEQGAFEGTRDFREGPLTLLAEDRLGDGGLAQLVHMHSAADCGGGCALVLRAALGPTYRIRIDAPGPAEYWQGHLVERRGSDEVRVWSQVRCVYDEASGEHWLRYGEVEHEPDSALVPALVLASEGDRMRGEADVPAAIGLHAVRVHAEPFAAALVGRVGDEDGRPVAANVLALPRAVRAVEGGVEESTDASGNYSLVGLEPGCLLVLVASDHRENALTEVVLEAGEERRLDFVLSRLALGGDVAGALVGPAEGPTPEALVRLVAEDGGPTDLIEIAGFRFDLFGESEAEPGRSRFRFEDVPAGRYAVSVYSIDGRRYAPEAQVVTAPTEEVVFTTEDAPAEEEDLELEVHVRDRVTGATLEHVARLARIWSFWAAEVETAPGFDADDWGEPGMPLEWLVAAPGYLPALVSIAAAERVEGRLVLDVGLEPGHGAALIVLDARRTLGGVSADDDILRMPSLAGARIVAGGRALGTSDGRGLAECRSPGPIEGFEVELAGWSVLSVQRFHGHACAPDGIGFVWMTRD